MTNRLQWDVLVSAQIPVVTSDLPPAQANEMVAHFFDAYFGQARCRAGGHGDYGRSKPENVDWIAHSGKNLTAIYATHGHGDHFFGVNTVQKKFPKARFVATSEPSCLVFPDHQYRRSARYHRRICTEALL